MKKKILPIIFCAFILIFCLLTIILPKSARSANEKRVLATFPEFTWENIKSGSFMSDFDTYVADHFAFRDKWVGLYSYASLAVGRNGANDIYSGKDGYLIAAPKDYNTEQVTGNLTKLKTFADNCGVTSKLMIVPEAGYILSGKLPSQHKDYYDDKLYKAAQSSGLDLIDLRNTFKENANSVQLYYKTDHHVTSESALLMYNAYCKSVGLTPKKFALSETIYGFYGTSYSKSGLWLKKPDTIHIYSLAADPSDINITIDGETSNSLLFRDKLLTSDKYEIFLNGNHDLTVIENNSVNNGKHLLIVKDSFSHCFTTFLAENYEEIVLIDLRYYKFGGSKLIDEYGITDVLFLYGAENLATSTDFGWLNF